MNLQARKHIVIVSSEFPPQPGGIGNHTFNLASFLSCIGFEVEVITDQRSQQGSEELAFDQKLRFKVKRVKMRRPRFLMYFKRVVATFQSFKNADFVIATGKFSLWNVAFCKLLLKRPNMAIVHGSEVNFKKWILRVSINKSLKQFDTIVAVSDYTKKLIPSFSDLVKVIPNGIDLDKWASIDKHSYKLNGNPVLTTVGRVSSRKGQLEVIKILPELLKDYPELQYHCIGIPTEADNFIKIAKDLGVENHVAFHGAVDREQLISSLIETDVFIMMSLEDKAGDVEGFGIAILEANALGIPAIGSTNCGIEDAIKNGESGYLVNQSDVDAFKQALKSILNNYPLFSKNAKNWAQEHSWELIIKEYVALIEQSNEN